MPNITIYFSEDSMPADETLSTLTEQCTDLCTEILHAKLTNVHIIYVAVRHGRGHPVFAEILYRLEAFRTSPVMEQFMEKLDDALQRNIGVTTRIRCFGYPALSLYARN